MQTPVGEQRRGMQNQEATWSDGRMARRRNRSPAPGMSDGRHDDGAMPFWLQHCGATSMEHFANSSSASRHSSRPWRGCTASRRVASTNASRNSSTMPRCASACPRRRRLVPSPPISRPRSAADRSTASATSSAAPCCAMRVPRIRASSPSVSCQALFRRMRSGRATDLTSTRPSCRRHTWDSAAIGFYGRSCSRYSPTPTSSLRTP